MTDFYVPLPDETEKLLLRLNSLYKKYWNSESRYKEGLNEIAREGDPQLFSRINTLVAARYLQDNNRCIPTDIGSSYTYLKREHYKHRYFFPASISVVVSIITTLVTLWLKALLCNW